MTHPFSYSSNFGKQFQATPRSEQKVGSVQLVWSPEIGSVVFYVKSGEMPRETIWLFNIAIENPL